MIFVAALLLTLWGSGRANAEDGGYLTANQLLTDCSRNSANAMYHVCGGYIAGISDLMASLSRGGRLRNYCLPPNATISQLVLVTEKYLKDHPADLNTAAAANVFIALLQAFPCEK